MAATPDAVAVEPIARALVELADVFVPIAMDCAPDALGASAPLMALPIAMDCTPLADELVPKEIEFSAVAAAKVPIPRECNPSA